MWLLLEKCRVNVRNFFLATPGTSIQSIQIVSCQRQSQSRKRTNPHSTSSDGVLTTEDYSRRDYTPACGEVRRVLRPWMSCAYQGRRSPGGDIPGRNRRIHWAAWPCTPAAEQPGTAKGGHIADEPERPGNAGVAPA